ncbi:MAG: hypothetical protein KDE48_14945, partial [Anaerolineales bacterium]|nr:hypothetical protein [Anaerolineales bacterium]
VAIPTTLDSALTLILAAPSRLAERYGASPTMDRIYALAQHSQVQGVVVDVMADTAVAAAYTAWDADPGSWQKANTVAAAIKALIDNYTIAYPNLAYLQIVGGDDIIPFYRIDDQNNTMWHEQLYASYVPPGTTVQAALNKDRLLTDDYYADRTPTTPDSPFWYDGHVLYLPDFAVGRLVETPDEIGTAVDSFLANNGQINIDTNLVGYLSDLTNDWGLEQCTLLQSPGYTATCTNDQQDYAQFAVGQSFGGFWSAPHANHFNTGLLTSSQLQNSSTDYSQSLMSTIGCHAGLNVAPGSSENAAYSHLDMAQAFLGQGGAFIGSTGYTFASYISVGYSEALLQRFTAELLAENNRAVGAALLDAKQGYYAEHSGWFDYNDEKVTVALTLYGFPMLQVTTPPASRNHAEKSSLAQINTSPTFQVTGVVTYTYAGLTVTEHDLGAAGIYYDHQGQSLAQELLPLQPLLPESIPTEVMGQTVRGMVLRQANYTSLESFDPVINQSFAMGAEVESPAEPPINFTGWDRQRPYHLGIFAGLNEATTSLNLILGLYNADSQTELLFDGLQFELLYSDDNDVTPPTFVAQTATGTLLAVTATDDVAVERIIAVCDNGLGVWSSIYLAANGADWQGNCPGDTVRAYAQIVDAAGNVTTTPWLDDLTAPPEINFSVVISNSLEDVTLTWESITEDNNGSPITVDHYEIWRSSRPYFLPAGSNPNPYAIVSSAATSYVDEDALGTSSIQYYYQVRAIGAAGQLLVDSQRVGFIAMTLVSGE